MGDVRNAEVYPMERPHGITIELLPTTGAPFLHYHPEHLGGGEDYEPFLETIAVLMNVYGSNIFTEAQTFPKGLEIGSIYYPQVTRGLSEDMYGLEGVMKKEISKTTSAGYFPNMIFIGNEWKRLDNVGDSSILSMFEGARDFRRWSYMAPQVMDSIYRNQRERISRKNSASTI